MNDMRHNHFLRQIGIVGFRAIGKGFVKEDGEHAGECFVPKVLGKDVA